MGGGGEQDFYVELRSLCGLTTFENTSTQAPPALSSRGCATDALASDARKARVKM